MIWLNSPFWLSVKVFSNEFAISCEYPNTPRVNLSSLDVKLWLPNLFVSFKVKLLTLALKAPFIPLGTTSISVVKLLYPIPVLTTIASMMLPFSITGLITAPVPVVSVTTTSGIELYSSPLLTTATLSILPFTMIGLSSPFLPVCNLISGITWWFNIDDP